MKRAYQDVPREEFVAEYGDEIVDAVESAITAPKPDPTGERAPEFVEPHTNRRVADGQAARDEFMRVVRQGALDGVPVVTDSTRRCDVFTEETDVPVYDSPDGINAPVVWGDLCFHIDSAIFAQVSDRDARTDRPAAVRDLLFGLDGRSIQSIREGLRQAGRVVPMPFLHFRSDGGLVSQEGRNRTIVAKTEGAEWVRMRVLLEVDS